ncbi:MAG: 4-(cytidine 5'-diphospho)-2-C-methyl-D-erythritol kinase [bacterium]|nr:4-(cytidine 5'-diphospho)-2-C-methyl-D-erythritol kinase [bacterium]
MSGEPLVARCPAKINLALRVLRRLDDGYHELDTVFQAIDLHDRLELRPGGDLLLECDAPGVPTDGENLVLRAARLLAEHAGLVDPPGAALRLVKQIPAQGGLGGGSSDAAAALRLFALHWDLRLDEAELHSLARRLGADVPFFLVGGTARGSGRGDRIEALPHFGERSLVLGLPPFGVPTGELFSRLADRLTLPGIGVSLPLFSGLKWPPENDFGFMVNDLEAVVFDDWPELGRFRDALLEAGAAKALLSGSGSTVYGIFDSEDRAREASNRLSPSFASWSVVTANTIEQGAEVLTPDR